MRALRKMLTALGAIVILLTTAQWYVYTQNVTDTDVVEVVLPTYKVSVDGKTIDNSSLMYPIINRSENGPVRSICYPSAGKSPS